VTDPATAAAPTGGRSAGGGGGEGGGGAAACHRQVTVIIVGIGGVPALRCKLFFIVQELLPSKSEIVYSVFYTFVLYKESDAIILLASPLMFHPFQSWNPACCATCLHHPMHQSIKYLISGLIANFSSTV
jgi:hypothetical protein